MLLFGREFWTQLIDFELLVGTGMISPGDLKLFHFVESADEAWERDRAPLRLRPAGSRPGEMPAP